MVVFGLSAEFASVFHLLRVIGILRFRKGSLGAASARKRRFRVKGRILVKNSRGISGSHSIISDHLGPAIFDVIVLVTRYKHGRIFFDFPRNSVSANKVSLVESILVIIRTARCRCAKNGWFAIIVVCIPASENRSRHVRQTNRWLDDTSRMRVSRGGGCIVRIVSVPHILDVSSQGTNSGFDPSQGDRKFHGIHSKVWMFFAPKSTLMGGVKKVGTSLEDLMDGSQ